jgi:hypothetical protein
MQSRPTTSAMRRSSRFVDFGAVDSPHDPLGVPVSGVMVETPDRHLTLTTSDGDGASITVARLVQELRAIPEPARDFGLYSQGAWTVLDTGWRTSDVQPLIGVAVDTDGRRFGIVPWFDGHESVLGGEEA